MDYATEKVLVYWLQKRFTFFPYSLTYNYLDHSLVQ